MTGTYIGHSGFSVELERCTLLFDYYQGAMPDFDPDKKLYVFANAYSDIPSQFRNALRDAEACAKGADVRPGLYNKDIEKLCAWMKENGY